MSAHSEDHKSSRSASPVHDKEAAVDVDAIKHDADAERSRAGVTKIEALTVVFGGWKIWLLYISIGLIMYSYSLESNTTYNYLQFATSSFEEHALLGTISTADSIISSVSLPFIAKIADITSRPMAYLIVLCFYVVGLILMASCNTVQALAAGELLYTVGSAGVNLVTTILLADITSLQWRGMASALASAPYILNAFIAGYITQGISLTNWRWGYGMFGIIAPACFAPALMVLFWAELKAKKLGVLSISSSSYAQRQVLEAKEEQKSWWQMAKHYLVLIDAVGLILLGTAFALILLPFTLASGAVGGWHNASMIAMEVVGWVLLFTTALWEWKYAAFPLAPRRILNRTFCCCVAIDVLYYLSGYIEGGYYSSYYYVIRIDWSTRDYTYFGQTLGVGLCLFAFAAAAAQRYTHSYKWPQLFGICMRIIGMALVFYATYEHATDGPMVAAQVMISLGGGFSVISTQTASQGSVPHADVGTAIALLSMLTNIGGAIGTAIAAAIWTAKMPANLAKNVLPLVGGNQTFVDELYESVVTAAYTTGDIRDAVVLSYNETFKYPMALPGLILAIVPLFFCFFTKEIYLGKNQNGVETEKEIHVASHDMDEQELAAKAREIEEREKARLAAL